VEWPYRKAMEYEENGQVESAIRIYQTLGTYKDSSEKLIIMSYLEGIKRYEAKEYSGAISYLQLAGDVKDAPEKLTDATYRLAMDYYNQEKYLEAHTQLSKIPEYKDAKILIKRIEDVVYRWEVYIYFNTDENGVTDESQINRADPLYIHFSTSGGMPDASIEPKVVWTYPDGDTDFELFSDVHADENNWVGWETGLFVDPTIATIGTLYVSIYDQKTGKLLASDSVELTK